MSQLALYSISEGLISATLILVLRKYNFLDFYELNKKKWMPNRCEFCLSFWICAGVGVVIALFRGELLPLIAPLLAVAIVFNVVK